MAPDALHGGGLAGGPDAGTGGEVGRGDGGDERVAGRGAGGEVGPLDGGGRMLRKLEPGGGVGDLDDHVDGLVGREHLEELGDGRDGRLVAAEHEAGCLGVDRVAPTGTGDRRLVAGPGGLGPGRCRPAVVDDDFQVEVLGGRVEPEWRQCADGRPAAVGQPELVSLPGRHDQFGVARCRQEQPHAGGRLFDDQPVELRPADGRPDEPGGQWRHTGHGDPPEDRGFAPDTAGGRSLGHPRKVAWRAPMPTNVTPEYKAAEAEFRKAGTPEARLECLREMLRTIPKHKGTEHLQAELKTKVKELTEALAGPRKGGARTGPPTVVHAEGAAQVALLGPPNSGKSSLHDRLTGSAAPVGPFPFTTQFPQPGMLPFEDIYFQLVDLPPVSAQHLPPWLANTLQPAAAALLVVDLGDPGCVEQVDELHRLLSPARVTLPGSWDPHVPGA